jgi:hypothetical protein
MRLRYVQIDLGPRRGGFLEAVVQRFGKCFVALFVLSATTAVAVSTNRISAAAPVVEDEDHRLRPKFGLPIDDQTIAVAKEETKRRLKGKPDEQVAPDLNLTDSERQLFDDWNTKSDAASELNNKLLGSNDGESVLGVEVGQDLLHPAVVIHVTPKASKATTDRLGSIVTSGPIAADQVSLSAKDLLAVVDRLRQERRAWLEKGRSVGSIYGALGSAGLAPVDFIWSPGRPTITIILDEAGPKASSAAADAAQLVASSFPTLSSTLRFKVDPAPIVASRDSSSGPMKAGTQISISPSPATGGRRYYCTSNISVNSGYGAYVVTAGHCLTDTQGSKQNPSLAAVSGPDGKQIGVSAEAWYNTSGADSGDDVGFVFLGTQGAGTGGLASQYFEYTDPTHTPVSLCADTEQRRLCRRNAEAFRMSGGCVDLSPGRSAEQPLGYKVWQSAWMDERLL